MPADRALQPDAQELILCSTDAHACETYLFEPGPGEDKLGWLFAAAQTEDRGGVGSELVDTVITAIQREYFREQGRAAGTSFELALHQANLILHDMAEQGMREWMPNFHVVVAALAGDELHVSVAGQAQALLIRKNTVADISSGLSQVPITNPLQTFSQVASGMTQARDAIIFATAPLTNMFAESEFTRAAREQPAEQIVTRLRQRYSDTAQKSPLAAVVVSLLPQYATRPVAKNSSPDASRLSRAVNPANLLPRQPLVVRRSFWQRILFFGGHIVRSSASFGKQTIWPWLKSGSERSRRVIAQASRSTGKNIQTIAGEKRLQLPDMRSLPQKAGKGIVLGAVGLRNKYAHLPKSSKIFAFLSLTLVVALAASIVLLQHKRAADTEIQRASEALHDARTKTEAAKTALIYDNRDQAEGLLAEAQQTASTLASQQIYVQEAQQLLNDINEQYDRLQRVTRAKSDSARTIGDFAPLVGKPKQIFFIGDRFFTYNPENNAIVGMSLDGSPAAVTETTQGIGFFTDGIVHTADKTITFITEPAGVALFDSKDSSITAQEIELPSSKPIIADVAIFGNRLYLLEKSTNNIFSYNKTLRGYSSGSPWINDSAFPSASIASFAIDGSIYTLQQDGSLRRLFKNAAADFTAESVQPVIPSTADIITSDEMKNIYVVDPAGKRIVIYTKTGQLIRQVLVEFAQNFVDAAIPPQEDRIYVLDGSRVLDISLGNDQ